MTSALEDIKSIDLEEWLTLNTASSPTKLDKGQSPDMQNVWIDEKPGSIITAPGYLKVGTAPSGLPCSFSINFFKTSTGTQTFVLSDNATVWTTVDFQNFTPIITGLSNSFILRGKVIRDKLWLTNGSDAVRTFDGTTVTVLDGSGSTPNVPKGKFIDYHDERVWLYNIPSNRSQAAFSALTDSSATIIAPDTASAWPSSNTLQISEGDADFGSGLLLYRGYLHFFKQYSIWRLVGYDEYTYTRVKTRASTGTRFNESLQILDSLVHLIGIDGIYIFDGEESERISDIIDPATASQTAFGFNQLQQPNQNNQFWEVQSTADWNAGTVPANILAADELRLEAVDSTQADFQAGTLSNIDATSVPGSIQLSRQGSGGSNEELAGGINAYFDDGGQGSDIYGSSQYLVDGDETRFAGLGIHRASNNGFVIDLSRDQSTKYDIGSILLFGIQGDNNVTANIQVNTGAYQTPGGSQGTWVSVGSFPWTRGVNWTPYNTTQNFSTLNAIQVRIFFVASSGSFQMTEIKVYSPPFQTSGKFISRTFDYGVIPNSFGNFYGNFGDSKGATGAETITFFTQSSADGSTWDSEVAVQVITIFSGVIRSTVRRYLRWVAYFGSDGTSTYILDSAFIGGQYISAIHDTGGNIFAWGAFQADYSLLGQTITFYYRTSTTLGGISATSWNVIVPSSVISDATTRQFVQFKIEISGGNPTQQPVISDVIINWVSGSGIQSQTLQNVASVYWRNRYWLSAAGPGATSNDTILIRGKKTFKSPWMLKDWKILSFARFQDSLYGCSSIDGSIYKLDTGYSKNGNAIDSYFETGDFVFGGFTATLVEMLVEVERMGAWNLAVGVSDDRGLTWTEQNIDLTTSSFDGSYISRVNLNFTGDRFRFRFRTNGADTPFQVHRCIVFYSMETERGSIRGDYLPS